MGAMFGRNANREAKLRYLPNGFQMIASGSHVICAHSGAVIPLEDLRYWSVERQEPYAGPAEASAALLPAGEQRPA